MKTILIILAILMLATLPVSAQIPRLINYQGVLTDDMGVVVSDGSYSMTFRLYDVPSGGSHLWEETIDVTVSKGIFSTTLGHDEVITEVFDEPLYLALEINGGGELSPRRIFTANAYAFSSRAVYGVTNIFPAEGNVGIGYASPEAPLHIYTEITDPNTPALLIQNTGNHSLIDFKLATVTEARIRYSSSNDFFFGTLTANGGVSLRTNDLTRLRVTGPGNVGIGTVGPLEKLDVAGAIRLGTTAESNEGTIRWTGVDFEGYDGSMWNSLTTGGGSGLPPGASTNTLRHNGADWVAATNLSNNGTNIGIGTSSPNVDLHIVNSTGQVGLQVDGYDGSWSSIYVNAQTAPGSPGYGYLRQGTIRGHHYLDSSYGWNLNLNSENAMLVEPGGYTAFGGTSLLEYMNIPGAIRIGNTTGSNEGTIRWSGSDFEGHDGAVWRSLTAGGLPSGLTNQTLRYDGGWTAAGNLYNNGTDIGIGTVNPSSNLHISEDTDAFIGIKITNPNTGTGSGEEIIFEDENGGLAGIRLYDDTSPTAYAGSMAFYNNRPSGSLLFRTGGVDKMKILETGEVDLLDGLDYYARLYSNANGGNIKLYDENGSLTVATLEADANGTGGYLSVARSATQAGFYVDGNSLGLEAPTVAILGASRSAVFSMGASGNSSVALPADAIGSVEMLDEPGVASDWRTVNYALAATPTQIAGRSITVPGPGYILAIGTTEVHVIHSSSSGDTGTFGVSNSTTTFPSAQNLEIFLPGTLPTSNYFFPVTVQRIFTVASAGTYTYYLLGREDMGEVQAGKGNLSLLYVPTSYGTVDAMASGDTPSDSDPSLERTESQDINNSRVERELAAMRERIAALEAELENR